MPRIAAIARWVTPRRPIDARTSAKTSRGKVSTLGLGSHRAQRDLERPRRGHARPERAYLPEKDPLRLRPAHRHHVAGPAAALVNGVDPRHDAQAKQERRHVRGEAPAARREVDARAAASTRTARSRSCRPWPTGAGAAAPPGRSRARRPRRVDASRGTAGRRRPSSRSQTVDSRRVPAVAVAADHELVPGATARVAVHDAAELPAGRLGDDAAVLLGGRRVAQRLVYEVAAVADEVAQQGEPMLRPSRGARRLRQAASDGQPRSRFEILDPHPAGGAQQAVTPCGADTPAAREAHVEHRSSPDLPDPVARRANDTLRRPTPPGPRESSRRAPRSVHACRRPGRPGCRRSRTPEGPRAAGAGRCGPRGRGRAGRARSPGTPSSLARPFIERLIAEISCWRFSTRPARAHELEVVHDDEAEPVLRLQPPALGPHLERGDGGRVVDEDASTARGRCRPWPAAPSPSR